jgi:hypothetical protein
MIRASDAKEEGVGNPQKKRPDTRIKIRPHIIQRSFTDHLRIRAADAKEVGVENPAEETSRYPNQIINGTVPFRPPLSTRLVGAKNVTQLRLPCRVGGAMLGTESPNRSS